MNTEAKRKHANDAEAAVYHPMTQDAIKELLENLGLPNDGLPRYGVMKVASYVAQIARAQALGFDPELLRMTPDESNAFLMGLAEAAIEAGKPVFVVEGSNT